MVLQNRNPTRVAHARPGMHVCVAWHRCDGVTDWWPSRLGGESPNSTSRIIYEYDVRDSIHVWLPRSFHKPSYAFGYYLPLHPSTGRSLVPAPRTSTTTATAPTSSSSSSSCSHGIRFLAHVGTDHDHDRKSVSHHLHHHWNNRRKSRGGEHGRKVEVSEKKFRMRTQVTHVAILRCLGHACIAIIYTT